MLNYIFTFFNINDAHMERSCVDPDTNEHPRPNSAFKC